MKSVLACLSLALALLAAPAIADARPHGGGKGGGKGGWERVDRGQRGGRPDKAPPVYDPGEKVRKHRGDNSLGAGWRQQQDEARRGVRQGRYVPLARVLSDLRRRTPGRQLDAGIEDNWNGRPVYRVRWGAANGRRIDYIVDAQTGRVLRAEGQ